MRAAILRRQYLRIAIVAAFVFASGTSRAACLVSADPRIAPFDELLHTDPAAAEHSVAARLLAPDATAPAFRAELFAALADAYSAQEKHQQADEAVAAGLALVKDRRDTVYINLLYLDALSPRTDTQIRSGRARAETLLKSLPNGSQAHTCALVTLGLLEHFADRPDQASIYLTRAYRASKAPDDEHQRILAATVLSMVLQALHDYRAALALSQEVIDSHERHNEKFELATAHFMRGFILTELRDFDAALIALARSRELSVTMNDTIGAGYADLLICTSNLGLRRLLQARELCESSLRTFEAAKLDDPAKQAQLALAEIDFEEHDIAAALGKLNLVLSQDGRDMPPFRVAHAFSLRSRAHRELKNYEAALADADRYIELFKASKEDERARAATAIRARFETDREIERNAFLQRELQGQNEKLAAQSARLRWMIGGTVMGMAGIVLLALLLAANRKKKRLLSRLATEDELTGLANRRHTLKKATLAFHTIRDHGAHLTLAILDLDHFKRINDEFGHAAGDFVLKEFARMALENVRSSDLLGRWGGEEFLLVMPNTSLDVALVAVERIRQATTRINGGTLPATLRVTASAGVASDDGRAKSLEDLIAEADGALYVAKDLGRDRVQVAQQSYDASATQIRRNLRDAGVDLTTGTFEKVS